MDRRLYLGVAKEDITPNVGARLHGYRDNIFSKSVHDRLYATAYLFQCCDVKVVLISATVCRIQTELAVRIRNDIAEKLSVSASQIILCATHTHSGPCTFGDVGWGEIDTAYCEEIFIPQICKAAQKAAENMTYVKMSIATGESFVGVNRREISPKDHRSHLGQNKLGPFDSEMTILSFCNENEEVVANIIHYAAHGTAAGESEIISRDWSGVMTDHLEKLTGGVTAFFNGAEGDIGPRLNNGKTVGNVQAMEELGAVAAKDAERIISEMKEWKDVELKCTNSVIRIPCEMRKPLEAAKREMEQFGSREGIEPRYQRTYQLLVEIAASYDNGYVDKEYLEIPQLLVRIGDVVFVSFPYELFAEIGMRIKNESKIPHTLLLSNANGYEGYFVTEDAFEKGGYEVLMHKSMRIQAYKTNADASVVLDTLKNLEQMNK